MRIRIAILALTFSTFALAQEPPATTQQAGHFPFLTVDARSKTIEVECEAIDCRNPLEFFLCATGTNEHESVLRSKVRPSHLHAALLMLGLTPGEPVHFDSQQKKWLPPHGPALGLSVRFKKDDKDVELPANRVVRDVRTKKEMPALNWIFAGSRIMDNGIYAADQTGYLVSVVNFDLTVIDIPSLASSANETLEWEINKDLFAKGGAPVTLIIKPAGAADAAPATQPSGQPSAQPSARAAASREGPISQPLITIDAAGQIKLNEAAVGSVDELQSRLKQLRTDDQKVCLAVANSIEDNPAARDVMNALSRNGIPFLTIPQAQAKTTTRPALPETQEALIQRLQQRWRDTVGLQETTLRDTAKAHADIINRLRIEQGRSPDQADEIQKIVDDLDHRYQLMTTPPIPRKPAQSPANPPGF